MYTANSREGLPTYGLHRHDQHRLKADSRGRATSNPASRFLPIICPICKSTRAAAAVGLVPVWGSEETTPRDRIDSVWPQATPLSARVNPLPEGKSREAHSEPALYTWRSKGPPSKAAAPHGGRSPSPLRRSPRKRDHRMDARCEREQLLSQPCVAATASEIGLQ